MFGLSRLLDRLPARRLAADLQRELGVANEVIRAHETAYKELTKRLADAGAKNLSLAMKLRNADEQVTRLTAARDEMFAVARERRRLLRKAGIKDKSDTGRKLKPKPELDEVIAVLKDELAAEKRRVKAYAEALEAAGLPLPMVAHVPDQIAALELSRAERELEAEVMPELAEVKGEDKA